jgi:hypothetical protein
VSALFNGGFPLMMLTKAEQQRRTQRMRWERRESSLCTNRATLGWQRRGVLSRIENDEEEGE